MGFISRKIVPSCGTMCVCCPALRSRSRQPVKRYKKLLADIFPKSPDAPPNERKIAKLCEYAAKNPIRIPKIAKYLEERCCKELPSGHAKFINVVMEAYNKLLCICKEQMAYFAVSLLNVVNELLDRSNQYALLILGSQTLTKFIYSQVDGTYAHNIEKYTRKICKLAHKQGEEGSPSSLRASSLQCLSAMVWFMSEFSYIFLDLDAIVHCTLDNYEPDSHIEHDGERGQSHHNWVNEVVRSERSAVVGNDSSSIAIIRARPEKKDPGLLTREEIEQPRVWAQICVQRMVDLAKESSTMRCVLDPMFVYFDSGHHWAPQQGLALVVLSATSYFLESSGHQQSVLSAVIRHLDHKNVAHDPQLKSNVVQVAAGLARQIRSVTVLAEVGFVSDFCRHLRKSLQASAEPIGDQELNLNASLQNSIEDCLLEIAKGIGDAQPLLDHMAMSLEKLPSCGIVARATIRALMILAHAVSLSSVSSSSHQSFPESLLVQLLKAMLHANIEVRVEAHQIFTVLLIPNSNCLGREASARPSYISEPRRWLSGTASTFASISALLEKLRKEKDGPDVNGVHDDCKERDTLEEEWKYGRARKNSPNIYKISSIIERTTGTPGLAEAAEPCVLKLNEDQISQLLSAFWMQASLPDNMPPNLEAIAHSFTLTLISCQLKNTYGNVVVRFFQLALSLRQLSLDSDNGILHPACRRSVFVLAMGMLMFAAKTYQVPELNDLLKRLIPDDVDPYMGISHDLQIYVKPQADLKEFGSSKDNSLAILALDELLSRISESETALMNILVLNLSISTEMEPDEVVGQLSTPFAPDDMLMFGPRSVLDHHHRVASHSKESLSFDEDMPSNLMEDDAASEASVLDLSRFIPKIPSSPSVSHIISIGKLLESALEVAGQVAGTSVSTSPLSYDSMARQCETLGTVTRKKLSTWLAHENQQATKPAAEKYLLPSAVAASGGAVPWQMSCKSEVEGGELKQKTPTEQYLPMKLPPASPYDNFLKAAGCK